MAMRDSLASYMAGLQTRSHAVLNASRAESAAELEALVHSQQQSIRDLEEQRSGQYCPTNVQCSPLFKAFIAFRKKKRNGRFIK